MKRNLFLFLISVFMFLNMYAQQLPLDIELRLQELKSNSQKALYSYRTSQEGQLYFSISEKFTQDQRMLIDSLGLELGINDLYDKPMRERILQLLQVEFSIEELDTLANRIINNNMESIIERVYLDCRFDTLDIYKNNYDSLIAIYQIDYPEYSISMYNNLVVDYLHLDTAIYYKSALVQAIDQERNRTIQRYKSRKDYTWLDPIADLAGRLGDTIFVDPLIAAINKPNNFNKKTIIEALVRMRVEPYYNTYFRKYTFASNENNNGFEEEFLDINKLVTVLRSQESFLELSKYLFSTIAYERICCDPDGNIIVGNTLGGQSYKLLGENVLNKELHDIIKCKKYWEADVQIYNKIYEWMQENYGNYQIKRLW